MLQSRVECIIVDKSTPTQISEMHKQTLPKQKWKQYYDQVQKLVVVQQLAYILLDNPLLYYKLQEYINKSSEATVGGL